MIEISKFVKQILYFAIRTWSHLAKLKGYRDSEPQNQKVAGLNTFKVFRFLCTGLMDQFGLFFLIFVYKI